MTSLTIFSTDITTSINHEIEKYFRQAIAEARKRDASYALLWQNLYSFIQTGGKRLRPQMVVLAYKAFGGTDTKKIIPIAAAHEFLHVSLLIHDDIIDRDYIRYGKPNLAGQYKAFYQQYLGDDAQRTHYAHSAAILGGDLMLAAAHELIMASRIDHDQQKLAHRLLSRSVFDVACGELLDTEASFVPYAAGDALKIALYKTAQYSFVAPLITGATLAKQAQPTATLQAFAVALGVAYQLMDDLLGVFGAEQQTGKSISSDIIEGKRTFLVERAMALMSVNDKILFNQAFGNRQATAEAINQVRDLLERCGAKQETKAQLKQYKQQAIVALERLTLSSAYEKKFRQLVDLVTDREF